MNVITYLRDKYHPLHRLRHYRWFRRLQAIVDFPVAIRNGSIKQRVYWLRDLGFVLLRDKLEEQTAKALDQVVKSYQPSLFLDVGANVGFYSWRVRNLQPTARIWMFEPDTSNAALLRSTVRENAMADVRLFEVAVSDSCGRADFVLDHVSGKAGSLVDNRQKTGSLHKAYAFAESESVECLTLDSLLPEMRGERILMKMDVEGAEEQALQGARNLLQEARPVIILECFDRSRINWLTQLDYAIHDLEEKGNYALIPNEMTGVWPPEVEARQQRNAVRSQQLADPTP